MPICRLVRWLQSEGDEGARGDEVAEIETDKAVVSITAANSGVLRKILVEEGTMVPVGSAIALVAGADEALPAHLAQLATQAAPPGDPGARHRGRAATGTWGFPARRA